MITPNKMLEEADGILEIYTELEIELLKSIVKRLKTKPDEDLTDWQRRVLKEIYSLNEETIQLINMLAGSSEKELNRYIQENALNVEKDTFKALNVEYKHVNTIDLVIVGLKKQANVDLNNFINESLISDNYGHRGGVYKDYMKIIQRTALLHTTGELSLQQALNRSVKEMVDKGLQSGFVDSSGRRWSIERYANMVIKTTAQRTYNEIRTASMDELGVYSVLVTSHPKSREACAKCQGKVIDIRPVGQNDSDLPSAYEFGYGTPEGHRGINCKHMWIPFVEGVNVNNQPYYDPDEAIKNEQIEQKRRYLARKIKKTKKELEVAKVIDEDNVEHLKKKLRKQRKAMQEYCDKHGLRRKYEYEKVYY